MAKKGKITTEEVVRKIASAYDKRHLKNLNAIKKAIDAVYDELAKEAARIGEATGFNDPASPFVLSEHPQAEKRIDELLSQMEQKMQIVVERGDKSEWLLATEKNAKLIDELTKSTGISKSIIEKWKEPNQSALKAFQKRKTDGMNLSQRVWRIKDQAKQELELALDLGLGEGKSAAELSRDVRKYLNEPKKLFRRVRDKHGVLHLSKRAAAYHPGQGVYRSSYRNAIRMAATETNIAYHTADYNQWQGIPLIKGIRIELSNNHTIVNNKGQRVPFWDICDELQGDYPKPFKFDGWHPFCRCIAVPIVATWDEIDEMWQAEDRGEDISDYHFKDEVKDMPDAFTGWMKKNEDRIEKAKSMPYFIKDNYKDGDVKKGLRWDTVQTQWNPSYMSEDQYIELAKTMKITTEQHRELYDGDDVYIDSSWSRQINKELASAKVVGDIPDDFMDGDTGTIRQCRVLDSVIKANTLKEEIYVYRKVTNEWLKRNEVSFAEGSVVHEYGYTSTSAVEGKTYMSRKDVRMNIKIPKGTHAYVTENIDESEIILGRNNKFLVKSVKHEGDNTIIDLELITPVAKENTTKEHAVRPRKKNLP